MKKYTINDLKKIIRKLRAPGGCPWDRKQTHASLRDNLVEETYEVIDAINKKDKEGLKEELGDLLLHIVFHADIEKEKDNFNFNDVTDMICRKLIRRHPHVFGNTRVDGVNDVIKNWEEIKSAEKKDRKYLTDGIPDSMAAVPKAKKILNIAYKEGFRWKKTAPIMRKLREEIREFKADIRKGKKGKALEDEFGDMMFVLLILARQYEIDAESALQKANKKFVRRFNYIEKELKLKGRTMKESELKEMLEFWVRAKKV